MLAVLGLAAQSAVGTISSSTAPTAPNIAELFKQLDSQELEVREKATRELRLVGPEVDGAVTAEQELKTIINLLRSEPNLSLEQETRLSLIGRDLFFQTDRGGMGVSFALDAFDGGVGIASAVVQEGFFAHEVLRQGDVIYSADGLPIGDRSAIRAAVLSHDPGDVMSLGILRKGEHLKVNVKLGNFSNLRNAEPPEPRMLEIAWRLRLHRELNSEHAQRNKANRPVVAGLLDEERWGNLENGLIRVRGEMERQAQATGRRVPDRMIDSWDGPPRNISAGGQPRRGKHFNLDGIGRGDDAARVVGLDRGALLMLLQQRQMRIQNQMIRIEALSDQLNQPGLNPRDRMLLEQQVATEKNLMMRMEADVEQLKQLLQIR